MLHSSDPRWIATVRFTRWFAPLVFCVAILLALVSSRTGNSVLMWIDLVCAGALAVISWAAWRVFRI